MPIPSLINILELSPAELTAALIKHGVERYRGAQILDWIYKKGVYDLARMTNLGQEHRDKLAKAFEIRLPEIVERQMSDEDKSVKLLLKLAGGDLVETVYMPMKGRETACLSSQVGCKFHCAFCASGQKGFFRNLTPGEILGQVLLARDQSPSKKLTNLVFMGIGEPFDNYPSLLKAIRVLNSKETLHLGARRITVSTCGIIPKIEKLSQEGLQIELSVSLHGPNDIVRGAIMPVDRAYPVKALIQACREYAQKTKRIITFEYILIKGVNASDKEASALARLLKGLLCKVNLIPYNPIEEFPHEAPSYPEIVRFQQVLQRGGIKATVRFSKGQDIQAACGQLRSVKLKESHAADSER